MPTEMTSTKPYIVRAFYDWICDNGLTPYIAVDVSVYGVMVPLAFVNDGQIVLNIAPEAVGSIALEGSEIQFTARFGGKLEHLVVPYGAISAIYAKENGAGTSLAIEHPPEQEQAPQPLTSVDSNNGDDDEPNPPRPKGRASLKVVK
ncbi:ClpXP protease specificity-enhancing factor [Thalassotalea marina]|uniref:Stringent starvation protein B n=1 Tax=Thalassotalea marina TaxID=1673741 RepID=A0A919BQ60_9GAMM|nr:ClpXP protease specificity-enhancing factor [Thalassotalea marina]GHG04667.1 stringent starvation protein B [Thalassotalea marina]